MSLRSFATILSIYHPNVGPRVVSRAILGSSCCREVALAALGGGDSSYSPGVVDADYSLSPLKTVCAW